MCMAGIAPRELALRGVYLQIPTHPLALHGPKCPPNVVLRPLWSPYARCNTGDPGVEGWLRSQNWP